MKSILSSSEKGPVFAMDLIGWQCRAGSKEIMKKMSRTKKKQKSAEDEQASTEQSKSSKHKVWAVKEMECGISCQ